MTGGYGYEEQKKERITWEIEEDDWTEKRLSFEKDRKGSDCVEMIASAEKGRC